MSEPYRIEPDRLILFVRLTPKGGRDALEGVETGSDGKSHLKARVRAVPEDGKANAALEMLLSKQARLSLSAVTVIAGQTARLKQVEIRADPVATLAALGLDQ
jgi:uncharacterized protein YggU (UPF0235/DUF167 family)